jgi:hypothetical protein
MKQCDNVDSSVVQRRGPMKVGKVVTVDITNRYGLDGPGIEYQWGGGGGEFKHPFIPALGLI